MKDIFIDNNLAKNFANPLDPNYKELVEWIINYNDEDVKENPINKNNYAHLVVNQKLLVEYFRSSYNCHHHTAIPSLINILTRQGRLLKFEKNEIEEFKKLNFTKAVNRNIESNVEDHCHICSILLSNRKMALTYDVKLTSDIKSIPGFVCTISNRPENLNYK
ncbi:hypothetical protein [Empedobacter brevis]